MMILFSEMETAIERWKNEYHNSAIQVVQNGDKTRMDENIFQTKTETK